MNPATNNDIALVPPWVMDYVYDRIMSRKPPYPMVDCQSCRRSFSLGPDNDFFDLESFSIRRLLNEYVEPTDERVTVLYAECPICGHREDERQASERARP